MSGFGEKASPPLPEATKQNKGQRATESAACTEPPLIAAARAGDVELLRDLLPTADLSATTLAGETALRVAIHYQRMDCVKILLQRFDAKAKDGAGRTSLMAAAAWGWAEGVKFFLPISDTKVSDSWGRTALMMAAVSNEENSAECVRLLLPHSNPRAADKQGKRALDYALMHAELGQPEIANRIRERLLRDEQSQLRAEVEKVESQTVAEEACGKMSRPSRRAPKAL